MNDLEKHVSVIFKKKITPNNPQNLSVHHLLTVTKSFPEKPATGSPSLQNFKKAFSISVKFLKAATKINTHPGSGPSGAPVPLLKKVASL